MRPLYSWLLPAAALAWGSVATGAEKTSSEAARMGAATYRTYCASCHGKAGKGDGPKAADLRVAPPDLTLISRRNGGKYPFDRVCRVIDGREHVEGHGGAGMPMWGDAFLEPRDGYSDAKVKETIAQLAHYLASIQKD